MERRILPKIDENDGSDILFNYFSVHLKVLPTKRRIFSQIMLIIKKAFTLFDHLLFLSVEL
jgi:hypothetical protein